MRFLFMAMAAVSLAVGGFKVGESKQPVHFEFQGTSSVQLPIEHPLTVALESPEKLSKSERQNLIKVQYRLEDAKYALISQQVDSSAKKQTLQQVQAELAKTKTDLAKQKQKLGQLKKTKQVDSKVSALEFTIATTQANADKAEKVKDQVAIELATMLDKEQVAAAEIQTQAAKDTLMYLDVDNRERVQTVVDYRRDLEASRNLPFLVAIDHRDELKLTPQQVTKLQLIHADFIVKFAPLREEADVRNEAEAKKNGAQFTTNYSVSLNYTLTPSNVNTRSSFTPVKIDPPKAKPIDKTTKVSTAKYKTNYSTTLKAIKTDTTASYVGVRVPVTWSLYRSYPDIDEKMQKLEEDTAKQVDDVLTVEQRKKLKEIRSRKDSG